jgi:hypothetical protein
MVHVLPPLPPELLEHGDSEDPAKEAQLEADLKVEQHRWISAAKKSLPEGAARRSCSPAESGNFSKNGESRVL